MRQKEQRKRKHSTILLHAKIAGAWGATSLDQILPRIGRTPRDRLAWAVGVIQRKPSETTPGDRENLCLELAAFAYFGRQLPLRLSSGSRVRRVSIGPADEVDVKPTLERLGDMLGKIVRREEIDLGRERSRLLLAWDDKQQRWSIWETGMPSLPARAAFALAHLLGEHGHLVRECPAPALRAKAGETCGTWFVAKRPDQEYCSATCRSRAGARAWRAKNGGA